MKTYIPNQDNVKALGRTCFVEDTLWMAFSGTGAAFTFRGSKAAVTLLGDNTAVPVEGTGDLADEDVAASNNAEAVKDGNAEANIQSEANVTTHQDTASQSEGEDVQTRIAIYVNGRRVVDDMMDAPKKEYLVFESEQAEDCLVEIVKLSETAMSTVGIQSIAIEAEDGIHPAPEKAHYVEIIGDSITCGYGVDDEVAEHHFSTKTEDVTKGYAWHTVKTLDVDYSLVCISGYGLVSGYVGEGEPKKPEQTMQQYYDKLGFSYGEYLGRKAAESEWAFNRQPELIVINLGTNDDSYALDDSERQEEYRLAYIAFLKQVRSKNPKAKILCTLGIMGDRLFPILEKAVEAYKGETGDTDVRTMRFTPQLLEDGYVADYHPTVITHKKAADKLTGEIKALMGW
ncbi:MAG: GDSL family lipase [Lachnospiraceae bacterium]|nr:GDSL family lipase [Lachnospiraceae bacterium]